MSRGYKPYELVRVGDIEYMPTKKVSEAIASEKEEHDNNKLIKAAVKAKKEGGIDKDNIQREEAAKVKA